MFNLFGKKESPEEIPASITYYTDKNSNVKIDINMEDYDASTINSMAKLLGVLARPDTIMETFEVLKVGITSDNREDVLIAIANLVQESAMKLSAKYEKDDDKEEQPCVKPSDML
jgi:hypothetical protein